MRELKSKYDFAGLQAEIAKSIPLAGGEKILVDARIRLKSGGVGQPVGWLRLTSSRLLVLRHRLAGADLIEEIPAADLDPKAELERGWVAIGYRDGAKRGVIKVKPLGWTGEVPADDVFRPAGPTKADAEALRQALSRRS